MSEFSGNPIEWFCDRYRLLGIETGRQARENAFEEAARIAEGIATLELDGCGIVIAKSVRSECERG